MSLYKDWTNRVVDYVKNKGEAAFWKDYGEIEGNIYKKILASHNSIIEGKVNSLAVEYGCDPVFFMGFLDGINESVKEPLDLESLEITSDIKLEIIFEKLYADMLEAKAAYLYDLPQWDGIFSKEKRKEIRDKWRDSKTYVNKNKIGRNDPCPCGSGKKYKNCCGKR